MFSLDINVKRLFFDRARVKSWMDAKTRAGLSRAGSFVRQRARSLIRFRKRKVSEPGKPPFAHVKGTFASLRTILFAVDPARRSVVIGPVRLNAKSFQNGILQRGVVPNVLEFGGQQGIREEQLSGGLWVKAGRRSKRRGRPTRVRTATYKPRPFMAPALAAEAHTLPKHWAGSVKAA